MLKYSEDLTVKYHFTESHIKEAMEMAFTLVCHACGQKLTLFDLDVKKRKGTIRCNHCGARISYDLDKRKIQQSGFWAAEEPAFDSRTKKRLMNQMKREEAKKELLTPKKETASNPSPFGDNPFAAKAGFAHFDLRTGEIVEETKKQPSPLPSSIPKKEEPSFKSPHRSHQKRTIRAVRSSLPSISSSGVKEKEKTFTPPPRIVTRTGDRHRELVRQMQKIKAPKKPVQISKVQSFWQKIKKFFSFHS